MDEDIDPNQPPDQEVFSLASSSSNSMADDEDLFEPISLRDFSTEADAAGNVKTPSDNVAAGALDSPRKFPPMKSRRKLSISDTPPEILHLVDSAIMGLNESVEMLQSLVFESDESVSLSVVNSLINTMGGAEGLDEVRIDIVPTIMKTTRAAQIACELIPWLPSEVRSRMVKGLLIIIRSCTRNRAMCTIAGLLRMLLEVVDKMIVKSEEWDFKPLCGCLQVLAGHSLSVSDLRFWLDLVKKSLTSDWAMQLILALEKAVGSKEAHGPANSFEFDGESSGLIGPGESKWPFGNGYGFATWVYMESYADSITIAEDGVNMPRLFSYLFSFLSSDNYGVEAYFHGQFLVVETGGGKGKKASIHFSYLFQPRCWYFIGLEHTCKQGLLGKVESEVRLYIDGNLHESRPFEYPKVSKPLLCCCIGTNPQPTNPSLQKKRKQCPIFGEMGPIYIFKEPIGQERMARLASRGGDYLPYFGNGAGLPWLAVNEHIRNLADDSARLDSEIGGSLHLLYHPLLLCGRQCPDVSPSGVSGLLRPAEVLGQIHVASRFRPTESLWSLAYGGPIALLPLTVSKVEMDSLEPQLGDLPISLASAALSAPIFRIISHAIQHAGNNEELCRTKAPELLSRLLHYLLPTISTLGHGQKKDGLSDEELVAAIVSLCQSQKKEYKLKIHLFSTLLLDLKMWSMCSYGLQKKLLSSLADMVFTESSAMRDANALQILLDGCRRCYWVVRETDSIDTFSFHGHSRPLGEVNALIDELLVTIELLIGGAASSSFADDDVRCLISFMVDCPQPNQVARVLHLICRLVVQPNTTRADKFAESFISCGGIESLLFLIQLEAKTGNRNIIDTPSSRAAKETPKEDPTPQNKGNQLQLQSHESFDIGNSSSRVSFNTDIDRMASSSESQLLKNLGGISFSISANSARNNVFNIDNGDGVIVGIINLLGALVTSGHLKFRSTATSVSPRSNIWSSLLHEEGSTMFDDKVSLLLFSLQKAFQAAPQRLMTTNVYTALLGAAINVSSIDEGLNIYDSGHRFEHVQLLLVLLRSLPYASTTLQARAIQDLLFLACSHPENRNCLIGMAEWPECLLEVIISNYEMGSIKDLNGISIEEIEDLVHNFLIIMLEHSMRQKDGWKDVEATVHCAEWLSMIGGSSTGDQRVRREEALPIFKRRLLGGLLDFAARELQVQQTEIMAAAAAGVAAEGLSPEDAKEEADNAVQLSVALAENAVVVLMLVEDHLRLQVQLTHSSKSTNGVGSPANANSANVTRSNSLSRTGSGSFDSFGSKRSSNDTGGLSLDILASMADANGQVSASVMERLTAAAAAEPYESVRCAFISYGSCVLDLAEGWKYRSKLWYGVGLNTDAKCGGGGGGGGWEHWNNILEKDSNENWVELPLVKKSAAMLQALLLDECAIGGGNGVGVGSGSGMCGIKALYQFLDSDQPFLCMLRMVLVSMREEDNGEDEILMRNISIKDGISEGLSYQSGKLMSSDSSNRMVFRKPRSALLWSVLGPILNMAISESKRQRVLVACCILYSEVWHAVGKDGKPLRKQYIENILPPFVAILRRWRPLLASIHELTSADYDNPLTIDDPALAAESLPIEAALSMITPGWAAAFASPPAAMALAMIAAGTSGGEPVSTPRSTPLRRDTSLLERRTTRLHTFSSFQKPLETPNNKTPSVPKDKAAAKAAALAAARDLERRAKIGTGRGLSAVAMATSAQRRSVTDSDRAKRWNTFEAMASAWTECLQTFDSKSVPGRDLSKLSYNYVAVLVTSFALARNMQRMEMDRRTQVEALNNYRVSSGSRAWRKLVCCLTEMSGLFGPLGDSLCNPQIVFWKLDSTISSMRMRRYMKRDYKVSQHINEDNMNAIVNSPEAHFDTSLIAEAISTNENYDDTNNENMPENNTEHDNVCGQNLLYSTLEVGPIFVPSEADERIILELPSSLVWPHITLQGNFQMTTKRVNFIVDEKSNSNKSATSPQRIEPAKNRSWLISSICQVYSRRYLLRMSALELFMSDRTSYLFDFGSIEGRKTAYRAIVNARPPHLNTCYMETQRPDQLLKKTQLMERWARWEISNFEYLMELNVLAGRSYNDLTQYPVFPWILVDYCSKDLNLENSSAYRDLSKPIGAQNPDRLKKYQERYSTSKDPATHKFHYDTHYSSAETVLYYLGRLEPFATLSIQLHGGKSKLDNHTLSDIGSTWKRALSDMRDVKELVPELFYMPEILMKADSFNYVTLPPWAENPVDFIHKHRMALESVHVSAHLHEWIDLIFGYKQRGEAAVSANNVFHYITYEGMIDIDKVADPVRQRAIQDKISLFGQTPFQLLTVPHLKRTQLEDSLHLKTIFRDPSNIKPFGVPNPEHCNVPAVAISATEDAVIVVDSNAPAANIAMHKWNPNTPDEQGIPFHFHHGESAAGSTSGAFLRMLTGPGSTSEEWQFPHALAFAASGVRNSAVVAITCDNEIITGGHADNSVKLISADKAKTIETASGHCAPVTCLALSPDSNYLVTGSRDTTVILWRMHRSKSQLNNTTLESTSSIPSTPTSPLVDSDRINILDHSRRRIEGPMHVLRGHLEEVVCCCVNSDLGLIASCSNSSGVLLHTIRKGRLIRKLEISNVHLICLSSQGVILVWNEVENKLSTFSVNGIPIGAKVLLPFPGIISCIETSIDGKNALLGTCSLKDNADYMESSSVVVDSAVSTKGNGNRTGVPVPSILFLDLHTLEVFHSLPLKDGQNVTAIALNNDNTNLLVSTADKQLIVFTDPSLSKKAAHQNVRQQ